MMQTILSALAPHLLELIGLLITGLLAWLVREAKLRWGIEIEEKHQRALHTALMTGARAALMRDGSLTREQVVKEAIQYAKGSVPDAMAALKPKADVLVDLATARAKDALGWK
jgi:hypothetical protein